MTDWDRLIAEDEQAERVAAAGSLEEELDRVFCGRHKLAHRSSALCPSCVAEASAHLDSPPDSPPDSPSDSPMTVVAARLKQEGNEALAAQRFDVAALRYGEALAKLEGGSTHGLAARELATALHLNLALAALKQCQWSAAETAASLALELDPCHPKAAFRRGVARARLGSLDAALSDLGVAKRAQPRDRVVLREYREVQGQLRAADEQRRNMSGLAHLRMRLEATPDDKFDVRNAMVQVETMAAQLPGSLLHEALSRSPPRAHAW